MDIVVCEELCDVACCMGSDVVVLKYSAVKRLLPEIECKKNMRHYFRTVYKYQQQEGV